MVKTTMELNFVRPPSSSSNWVWYPYVLMSALPMANETDVCFEWGSGKDSDLVDTVEGLYQRVLAGRVQVLLDDHKYDSFITAVCLIIRLLKLTPEKAILYVKTLLATRKEVYDLPGETANLSQIFRYRRPLTVLFCGDRDSAICFEESLTFELKALPKYSKVVHGGCRGVDSYAGELAKLLNIQVVSFPVSSKEWDEQGRAAGPIRNEKMLDETSPDMVLAFHVDISMSKGTRDMMARAWKRKIPVYLHDLKRKTQFEGDFSVL